ncbi:MAG: undecaprenyldiphospho-muramoylpentapeptide beta-N-acetylglucosaminyltransferase [Sediminibacterium sp.]|nr:undecaprenyldiphospho-muramoylpentapeptide beta-N-acetylglucosaminyltransferase [Sediminibacterium sp.]
MIQSNSISSTGYSNLKNRFIISGGGTGGHIFPAIAIARAIQLQNPTAEILFVGALGKMEMEKVPEAGFAIKGITIAGFNRSKLLENWKLPFQLLKSFWQVKTIFSDFRPDAVIGVGGYASFPVVRYAQFKGIDNYIHESNSYAGKANIWLGKKATAIFVGTAGMERFFPAHTVIVSGNPVRQEIEFPTETREAALQFFGLTAAVPVVLIMGGSLGARSINEAVAGRLATLAQQVQIIWQTGKNDSKRYLELASGYPSVFVSEFITRMDMAYLAADIIVSRSGAMSVAEICMSGKPSILVPYPLAAEDHQTANAAYLSNQHAAFLIADAKAGDEMVTQILSLAADRELQKNMGTTAAALAIHQAGKTIAQFILNNQ